MKFRTLTLVAAISGLALAACTPTDVDTGRPKTRTGEGAALGAATGAVAGGIIGGNAKGAIIGGIAGAAIGAAIGADLDRQAAELRNSVDGRIQIINAGDYLIVRMPQDILFAFDSDVVNSGLRDDLAALASNLQRYPNSVVDVTGHTDDTGDAAYNRGLSLRRANAVGNVLIANGVSSGRIRTYGAGEDQPIASNATADGRARNRRVDIYIRPN